MIAPGGRAARIAAWSLAALALAAAGAGLAQLLWHGRLFAGRFGFPLDLEWMEGGMLVHARRLAEGQPLYVKPSLDFIPFLYTPLYPAVLAALSKLLPLGYALGRAVSLVSFAAALVIAVLLAAREGAGRGRLVRLAAALVGVAGAGAIAGGYEFAGAFYDLVRSDSLLLLLWAVTLWAALVGRTWRSAVVAGVAIGLAFLTKQTAPVVGIGIGLGLLVADWRRGLLYGAVAGAVMGAGLLYLTRSSDGWFWTYIFELHQSHPFRYDTLTTTPKAIWRHEHATLGALALATLGLALAGRLRRTDAILWGAALAGLLAGLIGFATMWAWPNAYIPAVYFPVVAAAVLGARLVGHAMESLRPGAVVLAAACAAALGWQSVHAGRPQASARLPRPDDHAAARRFLDRVRALPGDGFIPFHPWYGVLVGKRPFVHRMGVMDVAAKLGRPEGLDQAMAEQRFPFIVLDWKSQPHEWPHLEARYRVVQELREGYDTVRHFSGADTWPKWILLPTRDPPALPAGARRLADFEWGHWNGWSAQGDAFGPAPAPAPADLFGRFAADSGRFGPGPTGTLRSPPLRLEHPRLRLHLSGPADPALRVLLLDGPETARAANPTGGTTVVDWEVADLVGRDVVLVIEDRSPAGGLALDEVVSHGP